MVNFVSKLDKKRKKLEEKIEFLQEELTRNLKQKTSNTKELDIAKHMSEIASLRLKLIELK